MGIDPDFWRTHQRSEPEFLEATKALELANVIYEGDMAEFLERSLTEREATGPQAEYLEDRMWGIVLSAEAAVYLARQALGQPSEDEFSGQLLRFLAGSSNIAFTRASIKAADQLVEEDEYSSALTLYKKAIDNAPRPGLHSELGCLLTYRSGVTHEFMGAPGDEILLRAWRWLDTAPPNELLEERLLSGPLAPDNQAALLMLALDAFARAYSYMILEAGNMTGDLDQVSRDAFSRELWHIMEGLHLVLARLERPDELELAYGEFLDWDAEAQNIGARQAEVEMERRMACYVGLARGWKHARGAIEASDVIAEAGRIFRKEDKREEARWIAEALREVLPEQVESVESRLAEELGATWNKLPRLAREALWQAKYLESFRHDSRFDWSSVVSHYCQAVEALLTQTFGKKLERFLDTQGSIAGTFRREYYKRGKNIISADKLALGSMARILQRASNDPTFVRFISEECGGRRLELRQLGTRLNKVNRDNRNPATHPSPAMHMRTPFDLGQDIIAGDPLNREAPLLETIIAQFGPPT